MAAATDTATGAEGAESGASAEGEEREGGRRRGRGRDRFRRERRPEGDAAAAEGNEAASGEGSAGTARDADLAETVEQPTRGLGAEEAPAASEAVAMAALEPEKPQAGLSAGSVATGPAATAEAAPQRPAAEPYVLPLAQLHQIAEGAGLQWVNSDAEKIAAVQAAIAAQPKPVHVPRERKPVVVVDEGPLVLVETRKDLSQMKLPFETAGGSAAG